MIKLLERKPSEIIETNFIIFFSRAASLSGATYLVTMVSVCMYGCMLDNCLTEKSITYSHTQRNFF